MCKKENRVHNDCHVELKKIIKEERIYPVFQPIVSLRDGKILGYEALSRIEGTTCIKDIEALFETAIEAGEVWELERIARKAAFESIVTTQKEDYLAKLFLNVSPHVINDREFQSGFTKECIARYKFHPSQIIFEITERESIQEMEQFQRVVAHYKEENYQIAIDDVGSGYSGLNLICDVLPHYIKLDMKLVRGVQNNRMQYAAVKGLIELSNISNIQIIAEGIETKEELESLINIGVQYGQGYFLGMPDRTIRPIEPEILEQIREYNIRKHSMNKHGTDSFYIRNIVTNGLTVTPDKKVEEVAQYFEKNRELAGVCVVRDGKAEGILTRERLSKQLSGRYGYSLYQNKTVSRIMERKFLEVDSLTPINAVSATAMEREYENLYDFIVVTEEGNYYGIVTIKDLLRKATEIDVNMAKSANPLTGLPGNVVIEAEIKRCIESNSPYTVMYLDIDNFKAYNDVYGFEKGDQVIRVLAEVLRSQIQSLGFTGHIGGDDFVAILYETVSQGMQEKIIAEFENRARLLYTLTDRRNGYVITSNRHGVVEKFPLLSVTVVSVSSKERKYYTNYEVSQELTLRKKKAKQVRQRKVSGD